MNKKIIGIGNSKGIIIPSFFFDYMKAEKNKQYDTKKCDVSGGSLGDKFVIKMEFIRDEQ